MDADNSYSLIPEGELRCIWMDAGVVSYKLCDRGLECEGCPFDADVRRHWESVVPLNGKTCPAKTPHAEGTNASAATFSEAVNCMLDEATEAPTPSDRMFHRNHFWLQHREGNVCRIGIDRIAAGLLRPVLSLVRSTVPAPVLMHEPCCWLVLSKGTISVPSPLDGTLQMFNPALFERPSLLDTDPYGEGWMMEIAVRPKARGLQDFVPHGEQPNLQRRQISGVRKAFDESFRQRQPSVGSTMYDGGMNVGDIETVLGTRNHFDILSRIFRIPLEP